jgi:hypothetical protein
MLVSAPWRQTVQDYFETGDHLNDALKELDPEDYNKMLAEVGMDAATARKLRINAKNDVLRSHANALPRDYTTINVLQQIPKKPLEALIEEGVIHVNLRRFEAEDLADKHCSDRHQRRRTTAARRVQIQTSAIEGGDADEPTEDATTDEPAEDQSETDEDLRKDPEQLAAEADDVIEAFREILCRKRRNIDRVRDGGDRMLCAMLASGLHEHIAAVTRLAHELDPPPSAPVEPSPNRAKKRRRPARKTKSKTKGRRQ